MALYCLTDPEARVAAWVLVPGLTHGAPLDYL